MRVALENLPAKVNQVQAPALAHIQAIRETQTCLIEAALIKEIKEEVSMVSLLARHATQMEIARNTNNHGDH